MPLNSMEEAREEIERLNDLIAELQDELVESEHEVERVRDDAQYDIDVVEDRALVDREEREAAEEALTEVEQMLREACSALDNAGVPIANISYDLDSWWMRERRNGLV